MALISKSEETMIDNDKEKKDNEPTVPIEDDGVEHTKEYYDKDRNRAWKNSR